MNILAFDTCFSACSAAVSSGPAGGIVSERLFLDTGHAEALLPMIERVMRAAGLAFADLDRIVVANGPGTFTGVRTGVAAARALALATRAEVVAVSSLWALAQAGLALRPLPPDNALLVAMDARKSEVYAQAFDASGASLCPPQVLTPELAAMLLPDKPMAIIGNAASAVADAASRAGRETTLISPDADATLSTIAPDARFLLTATCVHAPGEQRSAVRPIYLRAPDAKPQSDKSLPWSKL